MSDPVVIHPELAQETNSTDTSDAFHKGQRFHNPTGSEQATGNLKAFWRSVLRHALRRLPIEWPRHHVNPCVQYTRLQKKLRKSLNLLALKPPTVCTEGSIELSKEEPLNWYVGLKTQRPQKG